MICYMDMTFCPFYKDCEGADKCHRPLTQEISDRADAWAKAAGLDFTPISQFTSTPECHTSMRPPNDSS